MDSHTILIPNNLCKKAGMGVSWRPVNEVSVFPYINRNIKEKDIPTNFASSSPSSVFHLRQEVILFHSILRKLVNESNSTFIALQNLMSSKTGDTHPKSELSKISIQYRSIIRACLENLQEEILKTNKRDELQNYITIFYSVECIWHLCEILFIDVIPGDIVLPQLLDWVRFHFPKHERNAAQLLAGDLSELETHPEYWNTILGSLLQGRIKTARTLLRQNSASDSNVFKLVDNLLKAMPVYNIATGISVNEFNMQWKHWTMNVQSKIDAQMFATNSKLNLIMRLVVGEELAWHEIQPYCEAWYELLAGWLFYTEPMVKSFELGQFAKHAITKMRVGNHMKHLDRVLLAAMEFDILQVIKEIQHMSENGWFVTHLMDLLYHNGMENLEKDIENFSAEKLHESFILDYGILLMGDKSLWQVGLSYLDHCPMDGLRTIELLLSRLTLDNEFRAMKIIREAKLRDLNHVAQSICKVQGMLALKRNRLGNALTWALKSQDGPFTAFLADKFLQMYVKTGELPCMDLLDNLGSCMFTSDRLIFLGKYYEFHKLYEMDDLRAAGKLLTSLLASKIVPKYFWHVLLTDTIPLLECDELVLTSNDTFTIMHYLQEKEDLPELSEKIDFIRMAAARNLSRALVFEAQYNYKEDKNK